MGIILQIALTLFFCAILSGKVVKIEAQRRSTFGNYSTTDSLMMIRCQIKCLDKTPNTCDPNACVKEMKVSSKFGSCPIIRKEDEHLLPCRDNCYGLDWRCSDALKCCRHSCGSLCIKPGGIERYPFLPPTPYNLQLKEKRPGVRTVEIFWDIRLHINRTAPIVFLLEGRSYVGRFFSEKKLGPWTAFPVQPLYDMKYREIKVERKRHVGHLKLRPGRWYQFRVASVNENGTRGYSSHSTPFQLTENVRLVPPPQNLTFGPLHIANNSTISTELLWKAPDGEKYPITKYKISWFLRGKRKSLPINQSTVPQSVTSMKLGNLQPNSVYCVQVQAISGVGKNRSKSRRETRLLNTTISESYVLASLDPVHTLVTPSVWTVLQDDAGILGKLEHHRTRQTGHSITMRYLATKQGDMIVKASWMGNPQDSYSIELCRGKHCLDNPDSGEYRSVKAHTATSIEFVNLKFGTLYSIRLRVTNLLMGKYYTVVRTFSTPLCKNFRQKHFLTIKC
ncbi:Anosmin-1 [Sergentomyia squamirostris]